MTVDLFESVTAIVRDQYAHLTSGSPVVVVEAPAVVASVESCPRCTGLLMREVSDPSSARCMACGEPVRRLT